MDTLNTDQRNLTSPADGTSRAGATSHAGGGLVADIYPDNVLESVRTPGFEATVRDSIGWFEGIKGLDWPAAIERSILESSAKLQQTLETLLRDVCLAEDASDRTESISRLQQLVADAINTERPKFAGLVAGELDATSTARFFAKLDETSIQFSQALSEPGGTSIDPRDSVDAAVALPSLFPARDARELLSGINISHGRIVVHEADGAAQSITIAPSIARGARAQADLPGSPTSLVIDLHARQQHTPADIVRELALILTIHGAGLIDNSNGRLDLTNNTYRALKAAGIDYQLVIN